MKKIVPLALGVLMVSLLVFQYHRPFPPAVYSVENFTYGGDNLPSIAYPSYGQSAVGAAGYGFLNSSGDSAAVPTASTAKIITALAVLRKHPIKPGESGQQLTLDATDIGYFEQHYASDGSVVRVANGEIISQYDALTAMLLPSGNNMADSLARWAFGSQEEYIEYANDMVKSIGASQTTVADASGLSSATRSTASDMTKIALEVMKNSVFAEIVAKPSAAVPVAGTVNNVNWLLGEDGVVGVKTGSTDAAGGCFVFAANRTIEGQTVQVVGSILGAPTRNQAISDSKTLIRSMDDNFQNVIPRKTAEKVGNYTSQTGEIIDIKVGKEAKSLLWNSGIVKYRFVENHPETDPLSVGNLFNDSVNSPPIPLTLDHPPTPPTLWQKLLRL